MTCGKRMCQCNSGLCVKNTLCDYSPEKNPYESSSGIDLNPFEKNEPFTPDIDTNPIETYYKSSVDENSFNSNCKAPASTVQLYDNLHVFKRDTGVKTNTTPVVELPQVANTVIVNDIPVQVSGSSRRCSLQKITSGHIVIFVTILLIAVIFIVKKQKKNKN